MKKILIVMISSIFLSTAALAGQYGVGVTGSFAAIAAEGTEANKDGSADTSMRDATAGHNVIIPSAFAEYSMDNGFTLGFDYVIGSADVNRKKLSRTARAILDVSKSDETNFRDTYTFREFLQNLFVKQSDEIVDIEGIIIYNIKNF